MPSRFAGLVQWADGRCDQPSLITRLERKQIPRCARDDNRESIGARDDNRRWPTFPFFWEMWELRFCLSQPPARSELLRNPATANRFSNVWERKNCAVPRSGTWDL